MTNYRAIRSIMYILASLTLTLTSCGGGDTGTHPSNTGIGQVSGVNGRTAVLRIISITPSNPMGITAGTRFQFTAKGSYSDNSVQDVTVLATWTSSDTSVATVSDAPDSKGLATAVSKGYCSISATMVGISESTIMGIK